VVSSVILAAPRMARLRQGRDRDASGLERLTAGCARSCDEGCRRSGLIIGNRARARAVIAGFPGDGVASAEGPRRPYERRAMTMVRIGIDLGGTKIEAAALDASGAIRLRRRIPTPLGDYPGTIAGLVGLVSGIES